MKEHESCPICEVVAECEAIQQIGDTEASGTFYRYNCPRCGNYDLTMMALNYIRDLTERNRRHRMNLSSWIRERAQPVRIDQSFFTDNVKPSAASRSFNSYAVPDFNTKVDKLLIALEKDTKFAGDEVI